MAESNIKPTEEVLAAFNDVKMGKTLKYAIFKIEGDKVCIFHLILMTNFYIFTNKGNHYGKQRR